MMLFNVFDYVRDGGRRKLMTLSWPVFTDGQMMTVIGIVLVFALGTAVGVAGHVAFAATV